MSEIRKQKRNNRRSLPGLLPVRPSQLAGPASSRPSPPLQPSVVFLPSPRSCCVLARARPRGHLLLADALLAAWTTSAARPDPPALAHSSPISPSLSLALGRSTPSPPFAVATASDHPSLPRVAQKLRLDSLFLPTAPRVPGSPASPPRRRSPLRTPTTVADEFAVSSASPSPLRRPLQPR